MTKIFNYTKSKIKTYKSKLRGKLLGLKNRFLSKSKDPMAFRTTSYPYLSGDTFLAIADCLIINNEDKPLIIKSEKNKDIIFIENDMFKKKMGFWLC